MGAVSISIHAPHTGRDQRQTFMSTQTFLFQSTRPIRGATVHFPPTKIAAKRISIHAPHTGRDCDSLLRSPSPCNFNPRAPYGARPVGFIRIFVHDRLFQSTRPIRGATNAQTLREFSAEISIHAPHTGRDHQRRADSLRTPISIHAPHTGRDCGPGDDKLCVSAFQSTRPIRGATSSADSSAHTPQRISIHAPHTGRDHGDDDQVSNLLQFQSTRPIRGATVPGGHLRRASLFQSTRPIRGATDKYSSAYPHLLRFQSTRPIRGATCTTTL